MNTIKYDRDRVYQFICRYKRTHDGNGPSLREIQDAFQIKSSNTAHYILRNLVADGRIRVRQAHRSNIEVVGGQWVPPKEA